MEKPPCKSFGNTEYGAYYAMARLSRERAASHHHSTIGHRQAKAQGNGKDQKRHAPKEVKTSKKAPSSNSLGSHSSYFPLAIPHSFPFRSNSNSIMQLAQCGKHSQLFLGIPHLMTILTLVRAVQ